MILLIQFIYYFCVTLIDNNLDKPKDMTSPMVDKNVQISFLSYLYISVLGRFSIHSFTPGNASTRARCSCSAFGSTSPHPIGDPLRLPSVIMSTTQATTKSA